jgi:hypothetical protein
VLYDAPLMKKLLLNMFVLEMLTDSVKLLPDWRLSYNEISLSGNSLHEQTDYSPTNLLCPSRYLNVELPMYVSHMNYIWGCRGEVWLVD